MSRLLFLILGCLAAMVARAEDWSGGYLGISAGGFKGRSTWSTTQLGPDSAVVCPPTCQSSTDAQFDANGFYAGPHVGYNWLLGGHLLLGLETGAGSSNSRASLKHTPGWADAGSSDEITATYGYNGGAIARIGLVAGPLLFYGVGGPWWQKVSIRYNCTGGANSWCLNSSQSESKADVLRGWVAGGGVELRVASRWSTRLDYRYAKYENKDYSFFSKSATDTVFARTAAKTYTVALGISYRF